MNPPDACKAPPRGPCTDRVAGYWCGATLGLDRGTLYSCDGGDEATAVQACSAGCQVNPDGSDDYCR